jgi:hypothetical protein
MWTFPSNNTFIEWNAAVELLQAQKLSIKRENKFILVVKAENLALFNSLLCVIQTITVAARSKTEISSLAWTLGWWVRIPLKTLMFVCVYSVFVLPCVGSGFVTGWSPVYWREKHHLEDLALNQRLIQNTHLLEIELDGMQWNKLAHVKGKKRIILRTERNLRVP